MTVRVRLFAILRERVGSDSLEIELPEGATVADALAEMAGRPPLGDLLDRLPVRMAVNRGYAEPTTPLRAGDELLEPEEEMRPGGVRNSNAYTIPALAERAGAEAVRAGSAADDLDATREAIAPALDSDVVVLCGGVSVGEHDHVKEALAELGVQRSFWGVALKPGKPTWFGTRGATLVFGLPGNPVSAMVTFVLLVRPALLALGGGRPERLRTTARLGRDCDKPPGRTHALRCRLELREDGWHAHPFERQASHVLTSMLGADCLALLPAASGPVRAGERVEVELLDPAWEGGCS